MGVYVIFQKLNFYMGKFMTSLDLANYFPKIDLLFKYLTALSVKNLGVCEVKIPCNTWAKDAVQMVEHMPTICEVLSSILITIWHP